MLDLMRKHARSWFIQVALFGIILVFVFWGVGTFEEDRTNRIATVNKYSITINEYRQTYENLLRRYRDIYKNELSEKLIDQLKLKEQALEGLIETALLIQEAERLDLRVTEKELKESILNHPAFQKDGAFDHSLYERLLRYYRMTAEEFEVSQRRNLLIKKVENFIKDNSKISDKEVLDAYTAENESINIEFVSLKASSFLGKVRVAEEEIKDYFSKHKEEYQIPAKVNVRYLSFDSKDYESKVEITEDEISDYYQSNIERFTVSEKIKARHILIKSLENDDPPSVKKAREKAEKIMAELQKGADFAALARKYSDDPSSAKEGGDLGYVEREKLMEPIKEAVSSIKAGEVSPIIKTPFGFHIIKVEKVINPTTIPLKQATSQIASILRRERAQELADDEAENLSARIIDEASLGEVAASAKMNLHETGLFSSDESVKGIGRDRTFYDAAFSLAKGEISQVVKASGVNYIFQVTERLDPRIPELHEVKEKVKEDVRREKGKAMAREEAERLLEELRTGTRWKRVVSKNRLGVKETGFFTRRDSIIPEIGYVQGIKEEVFSLTPGNPYASKVFEVDDAYLMVRLKGTKGINEGKFNVEKRMVEKLLVEQKREWIFRAWLNDIKARAEIKRDLSRAM